MKQPRTQTRSKAPMPGEVSGYSPRIIVKFRDRIGLPYVDEVAAHLEERDIGFWQRLTARFPGISIRRLFNSVEPDRIQRLVAEAAQRNDSYRPPDFLSYFVIDTPADIEVESLLHGLSEWKSVESAYMDSPGEDPGGVSATDPGIRTPGHLDASPYGIDARFAWRHQGGDGTGQQVIDLEKGWTLDHQDILAHGATELCGENIDSSRPHGTSVLCVICAVHGQKGSLGIAPNVGDVKVISYAGECNLKPASVSSAILKVIESLPIDSGAVLLLEVQKFGLPVEYFDDVYIAIELAVERGITIVEPAANGGINGADLDTIKNGKHDRVLNRTFRDSGAIMVAAASSGLTATSEHARMNFSNYGSRVDCYAWGENVGTATSTPTAPFATDEYTLNFYGTSSASAIIAGAALLVQSMAMASLGSRLKPSKLRSVLANQATGTRCDDPTNFWIGVMPDLRAIINSGAIGSVALLVPPQR